MARAPKSETQIVTANRLADGVVVFLGRGDAWTSTIGEAAVARDASTAAELLARGDRDAAAARVVMPYLVAVIESDGVVTPVALRERIRAEGLTFRAIAADAVTYF